MNELDFQRLLYVRVSDVIGKQTYEDMCAIPAMHLTNAAIRGTKVHDYCSALANNLWVPDIEMEYEPYVSAFMEWYEENVDKLLHMNTRLYDDEKKITGEFDMIVLMKNDQKIAMLDLKTSANVSRSWPIQLSAYKHLCEINGYHADVYMNIHLKKTKPPQYETIEEKKVMVDPPIVKAKEICYEDLTSHWEIFSSALNCYDYFSRPVKECRTKKSKIAEVK